MKGLKEKKYNFTHVQGRGRHHQYHKQIQKPRKPKKRHKVGLKQTLIHETRLIKF